MFGIVAIDEEYFIILGEIDKLYKMLDQGSSNISEIVVHVKVDNAGSNLLMVDSCLPLAKRAHSLMFFLLVNQMWMAGDG